LVWLVSGLTGKLGKQSLGLKTEDFMLALIDRLQSEVERPYKNNRSEGHVVVPLSPLHFLRVAVFAAKKS
jgi:hypothetical protein